jgi:ribosome-associated heat shock protein Hsp15
MSELSDRLDKYLWAIRVFKTRSQSSEACRKGAVQVNDIEAKASRIVKTGDVLKVRKNPVTYTYKVIEIPNSRLGAKLVPKYVEDQTSEEELSKLKVNEVFGQIYRKKGTGRPTKKERRDIDQLDVWVD